MNESSTSQIRELLLSNETVGIVVGKNPSIDAMASALALYLSQQTSGKKVFIASATEPTVELSSLVGIDRVENTFEGEGGDLIVSFPYREGEIDKVSYTLEEGFLNIVVKPGELGISFTEDDVIYRRKGEYPKLIFTIGVPRISDLSSVFDITALKDTKIVNIDNSSENQGFGDVVVLSDSSSVSEEVSRLMLSLGFEIDLDVAQNLLSGIASATNNFQNPNTTPAAFEMAGVLMGKGAVRQAVARETEPQPQKESSFASQNAGQVLQQLAQRQGQRRGDNRPRNFPQRGQQSQGQNQQSGEARSSSAGQQPQSQEKIQNPSAGQNMKNPPEEWLTPKVYKGSTNV